MLGKAAGRSPSSENGVESPSRPAVNIRVALKAPFKGHGASHSGRELKKYALVEAFILTNSKQHVLLSFAIVGNVVALTVIFSIVVTMFGPRDFPYFFEWVFEQVPRFAWVGLAPVGVALYFLFLKNVRITSSVLSAAWYGFAFLSLLIVLFQGWLFLVLFMAGWL